MLTHRRIGLAALALALLGADARPRYISIRWTDQRRATDGTVESGYDLNSLSCLDTNCHMESITVGMGCKIRPVGTMMAPTADRWATADDNLSVRIFGDTISVDVKAGQDSLSWTIQYSPGPPERVEAVSGAWIHRGIDESLHEKIYTYRLEAVVADMPGINVRPVRLECNEMFVPVVGPRKPRK